MSGFSCVWLIGVYTGDSPTEVLFLYTGIDDFVMHHLYQFNSRRIISIESSDVDVKSLSNKKSDSDKPDAAQEAADAAGTPPPVSDPRHSPHPPSVEYPHTHVPAYPRRS